MSDLARVLEKGKMVKKNEEPLQGGNGLRRAVETTLLLFWRTHPSGTDPRTDPDLTPELTRGQFWT